ncbi:MAG: DUF1295 domain-containing protein [Jatrophihabitans sp.]|uniref:DUF1295 domain-containing protein n=1 Tax=Jatrophihabitans sp. TaxID=1932789 RepID=UPI003F818B11
MSGVDWGHFGVNLAVTAGATVVTIGLVMAVSMARRNHSFIDIYWGPGFAVIALVSYLASMDAGGSGARRAVVLVLTAVWALRLGAYLASRNLGAGQDKRYTAFLKYQTGNRYVWLIRHIYGLQGLYMWFISIPVQLAMYEPRGIGVLEVVAIVVWAVGFAFEAVGDWQLSRFKSDPANAGRIMDRGLWAWTRHPNYFGDATVWFALWLCSLGHWAGLATVLSPVLMWYCLVAVGGKKLTEKGMRRSRGQAFDDYVARTSGFFPRPPKRVPTAVPQESR